MKLDRLRDRFFEGAPRYRWLDTIGRGGMGIVFKAHDLDLDEVVAIKVLSPDLEADDQELLIRFKREINLNRKIKHPNVARIHDFGTSGDYPYITMEYVPGKDLRTLIQESGRLAPAQAISILRQIALGTNAAHKLGIVHRDLKSQNVMIDDSGAVAILDFGLARGMLNDRVTVDSIMIGTPHYMAPEQALGKPTDARSDLYSIGVIAYECLTGTVPFVGDSPLVIAMSHVSEPVNEEPLREAGVSPELAAIVIKALSKTPADRYQSAQDLEAELAMINAAPESAVPGRPASPPPPSPTPAPHFHTVAIPPMPGDFRTPPPPLPATPPPSWMPPPSPPISRPTAPPPPVVAPPAPSRPVVPTPVSVAAPALKPAAKDRAPVVLIVDDHTDARDKAIRFLSLHSCRVLGAKSGQEALETMLKQPVDLVLMDVKLPDMDGFDVARIIKSQASSAMVPIVLMSDRLDRNRFAFGIQSGATDLLSKPLALESMMVRLWNILSHRGFIPPTDNQSLQALLKKMPPTDSSGSVARVR